ncbi:MULTISPECIES: photosystem II biosynthesis protein [Aphanothece]|uniref:photosystem II biosynthesis protein n=1 Tax=Aphanothece TaxID=1121 RepID=UPI0039846889
MAAKGMGNGVPRNGARSSRSSNRPAAGKPGPARQQVIPDAVANRMARRVAIATGIPTLMGMGVFVASYVLVSRQIVDIPPGATLVASGGCFLLGLVGLSYGVLSASWEDQPGSPLGTEQIGLNISRLRASVRAMRQGGGDST